MSGDPRERLENELPCRTGSGLSPQRLGTTHQLAELPIESVRQDQADPSIRQGHALRVFDPAPNHELGCDDDAEVVFLSSNRDPRHDGHEI